jgi:Mrp family chromosome partitioning ATPase
VGGAFALRAAAGRAAASLIPSSPPPLAPPVAVDLSRFVGLDGVFAEIDELVAARAGRISPLAPATLVLLVGPRGTGKSSVALALAAKLHRAGARNSDRIVAIGPAELHGLGGSYGPSEDGLKAVGDRIQAALDGTLLIDDLDCSRPPRAGRPQPSSAIACWPWRTAIPAACS